MERRRRHKECGVWCEVLVGRRCVGKGGDEEGSRRDRWMEKGFMARGTVDVGFALGMVGLAKWFEIGNMDVMICLVVAIGWVMDLMGVEPKLSRWR